MPCFEGTVQELKQEVASAEELAESLKEKVGAAEEDNASNSCAMCSTSDAAHALEEARQAQARAAAASRAWGR